MKNLAKVLLVNFTIVIIMLCFCEFFVREFIPQIKLPGTEKALLKEKVYYDSPGLEPNSKGLSCGMVKFVNSSGFWKYSKSDTSSKKWLFLGDSITMGIGIESDSTFTGLLNNSLTDITILNPSLIGYSSKDYLNITKKLFYKKNNKLKISKVFIFWCLNDVYSNYELKNTADIASSGLLSDIIVYARNNFKLYHFLKKLFFDRPKSYYLYDRQFYNTENQEFKKSVADLINIKKILDNLNVDMNVILLPYEYQLRRGNNSLMQPQIMIKKVLKNSRIKTYNFSGKLFMHDSDNSKLYLYGDGIHFSKYGHRMISRIFKNTFTQIISIGN